MSLFTFVPVETHHELAELVLPTWAFPTIAAGVFLVLAKSSISSKPSGASVCVTS